MGTKNVLVLGGGIVGLSVAIHLRRRGVEVTLIDRAGPGAGASFGNGGLIQREAVFPYRFPRDVVELFRMARNRSVDVSYELTSILRIAPALWSYWRHSSPNRYEHAVRSEAALIATCLDEHLDLAAEAGVLELLRPIGWLRAYSTRKELDTAVASAEMAKREFQVNFAMLDSEGLHKAEPYFLPRRAGAIHWEDSLSLSDPGSLIAAHARLFERLGGKIASGDGTTLEQLGSRWTLPTSEGRIDASDVVVAMGAFSDRVTRRFGYSPPLFGKRGYHMHYSLHRDAVLNRPLLDSESAFLLAPMNRGVRLTTGVEFSADDKPSSPIQLERAEVIARGIIPLKHRIDSHPWMGIRPCMPDMIPVIGPAPGIHGMWCAFGHGHQGMTLGPTTGRMLAEMMTGESPFVDPSPYRADRFCRNKTFW